MVEFTFEGLFRTTNKGLPDTSNLPPYTYMTTNHFVFSLIVEILIGLVITMITALSVYRAFYRIKDSRFNVQQGDKGQDNEEQNSDEKQSSNQKDGEQSGKDGQQASQTNDNLIYRFDQDQSEKDSKQEKKEEQDDDDQDKGEEEQQEEQVSEQTTQWYLDLDRKVLFFQPFLISFAVVVNIFASNVIVLLLLGLVLILFYMFNVKAYLAKKPIMQILFTLPCIVVLLMVYFEDRDMST